MRHTYEKTKDIRAFLWWASLRSHQRGGSWEEEEEQKIPPVPPGYRRMKDGETEGCVVWFEGDYVRAVEAVEEP